MAFNCKLLLQKAQIIPIPKKSHFTIFLMQNFMQNMKKRVNSISIVGIMF